MNPPIVIRPGMAGDVDEVVSLERTVAEAPHWSRDEYKAMVRPTNEGGGVRRCLMVAEAADGALAGFVVVKVLVAAESAELESVAVVSSARRRGLGMRLCRAAIEWCQIQGAASIELEVRSASLGVKELYERLGFVEVGLRRTYYREPSDDAVLMRLDLKT